MKKLRITVGKKTYDVTVEVLGEELPATPHPAPPMPSESRPIPVQQGTAHLAVDATPTGNHSAGAVLSPMAGVIKSILVKQGEEVAAGTVLMVLEAMKMDNKITASSAGSVSSISVQEGENVQEGQELLALE